MNLSLPLPSYRRWLLVGIFSASALGLGLWMGWFPAYWFAQPDAGHYLDIAAARTVMQPFALRQLSPLVARWLAHLLHLSLQDGFLAEGIGCLAFFVGTTGYLTARSGAPRFVFVAVAASYFWGLQFEALAMPDLLYAALLCGLLLLLQRGSLLAASLMMFPLMLTRESTVLTLACFLAAGWSRLRAREIVAAVGATLAGWLVVRHLSAGGLPNHEHISAGLYLLAKMPWNFLRHILGVDAWANVYPECGVPVWQLPIHIDRLTAIGSCGFQSWLPARTFAYGLAIFGLLPLLVLHCRWSDRSNWDLTTRFAILYGGVSFLLAPLLGDSLLRLFGYGWPLFLVGLPILLGTGGGRFRATWASWLFLAMHLALSWSIFWLDRPQLLVAGIVLYAAGWCLLRMTWETGGDTVPQTSA